MTNCFENSNYIAKYGCLKYEKSIKKLKRLIAMKTLYAHREHAAVTSCAP